MKFSPALLFAVAAAEDKKVPPRHPLQRLNKLVEFSEEILNEWYTFLPSKDSWVAKFAANAERMERNFNRGNQRCGYYDESSEHGGPAAERKRREASSDLDRYNREDPVEGTKQITTGFRKWAERYLANDKEGAFCKLQPAKQVARANKWHDKLVAKLAENL